MPPSPSVEEPKVDPRAGRSQRRVRNYLLDARFQLKFTGYVVGATLVVAGLLGAFLWSTTRALLKEAEDAVQARSLAAQTSKDLNTALLNNKLFEHFDDPAFEEQLKSQARSIDLTYEKDRAETLAQREQLVQRQRVTGYALLGAFVAFIGFIALASIVTTHKIVGPLYRAKRLAQEIGEGRLKLPAVHLRQGDELQDLFEAFSTMVAGLRERQSQDLRQVERAIAAAERSGADAALLQELRGLEEGLRARLD